MEIKIEKGIPIPAGSKGVHKYPFAQMEVGDSFFTPCENLPSLRVYARQVGKEKGLKFSVRQEEGGARVWRVA